MRSTRRIAEAAEMEPVAPTSVRERVEAWYGDPLVRSRDERYALAGRAVMPECAGKLPSLSTSPRPSAASAGLTLIETLAALVLLSLIAAVCASVLRGAAAVLRADEPVEDLARVADAFLDDPEAFGFERFEPHRGAAVFTIPWPDWLPSAGEVIVSPLTPDDPEAEHTWLVFTHGAASVSRWVPLADPDPQ